MTEYDERYVRFREHADAQQRLDMEISRLRERQATTEATLLHEVAGLRGDVSEVKQLMLRPPPPPPVDNTALAMHRALDTLTSMQQRGGGSNQLLVIFAVLGALALGFAVARFVLN